MTRMAILAQEFTTNKTNFPHLFRNIPASAYGVYISELIRCARACSGYTDFENVTRKNDLSAPLKSFTIDSTSLLKYIISRLKIWFQVLNSVYSEFATMIVGYAY